MSRIHCNPHLNFFQESGRHPCLHFLVLRDMYLIVLQAHLLVHLLVLLPSQEVKVLYLQVWYSSMKARMMKVLLKNL